MGLAEFTLHPAYGLESEQKMLTLRVKWCLGRKLRSEVAQKQADKGSVNRPAVLLVMEHLLRGYRLLVREIERLANWILHRQRSGPGPELNLQ